MKILRLRFLRLAVAFSILHPGVSPLYAWHWAGANGDWANPDNWISIEGSGVPGPTSEVEIRYGDVQITEPGTQSGKSIIGVWQINASDSANVTVAEGASWAPAHLFIAYGNSHNPSSNGALFIHGGTVTTADTTIAIKPYNSSEGVIPMGSLTITSGAFNSESLSLGNGSLRGPSATGTMNIHGGTVTTTDATIGSSTIGVVTITDGVWRNAKVISLGFVSGIGTLNMEGGLVASEWDDPVAKHVPGIFLGSLSGSDPILGSGTVNLNAGVLVTPGFERWTGNATLNFNGGLLRTNRDSTDYFRNLRPGDATIFAGGAFIDTDGFDIISLAPFDGVGALTKLGAGTLTLSGTSDYLGGTFVNGGALIAASDSALGDGTATVSYATMQISEGVTLANPVLLQENGILLNSGTLAMADSPGGVAGVAAVTLTDEDAAFTNAAGTAVTGGHGGEGFGAGAGGAGILLSGTGGLINNGGGATITGGAAGDGFGGGGVGGAGGAGIVLGGAGNTANNNGGAITGGKGGHGAGTGVGGRGGSGVAMSGRGGLLDNQTGTILGGDGGVTSFFGNGAGGAGVLLGGNGHTLVTGGTISGGLSGSGIRANSVTVTEGDHTVRLLEGFQFVGAIGVNTGSLTFDQGADAILSTPITGAGAIAKTGAGALTLSGTNTFTGGTTVSDGILILTDVGAGASVLGTGPVLVEQGGALAGSGTVLGATSVAGLLAPGNSPGAVHFENNLMLDGAARVEMELASNLLFDQIFVQGTLVFGGTLNITLLNGFTPGLGAQFALFDGGYTWDHGTFSAVTFSNGAYDGDFDYNTGVLTLTAVPEPSSTLLLLMTAIGALVWRWKTR